MLEQQITAALDAADAIVNVAATEGRNLTADENTAVDGHMAKAKELRKLQQTQFESAEMRSAARAAAPAALAPATPAAPAIEGRTGDTPVGPTIEVREKDHYSPTSSHSFFRDLRSAREGDAEARTRLTQSAELEAEKEGRALTSSDGTGGYFVAPTYLQNEFIELREYQAVTLALVTKLPLPPNTDSINIPKLNSGTTVATATENTALSETSITDAIVSVVINRIGGKQTVPNTLIDRSMPGIDQVLIRDLAKRAAINIDTAVLVAMIAAAATTRTYTSGSPTAAGFWPVVLGAVADVRANYKGEPEGMIYAPRRLSWLAAQLDGSNRPFYSAMAPQNAMGNTKGAAQGPAGNVAGFNAWADGNMPVNLGAGTNEDRVLVGAFSETYLFEGAPKFAASVDEKFSSDQTVLRVTQDYGVTASRYAGALSLVSGTALNVVL